jgi:hypothetical protein
MNWHDVETIGEIAGLGVSDLAECLLKPDPKGALAIRLHNMAQALDRSATAQQDSDGARCAREQSARCAELADRLGVCT